MALLVPALLVLTFLWTTVLWSPRPLLGVRVGCPRLIGHRGVRGSLPENTLAAFRAAFDAGLDGVECDVQRTHDGALVLVHDFDVEEGSVVRTTLKDLRRSGPIPERLEDLLESMGCYPGRLLNIELKVRGLRGLQLARSTAQAVREAGLLDRVLVSSFSPLALLFARVADSRLRVALLFAPGVRLYLPSELVAALLHVDALHPHYTLVDGPLIARAHRRRLSVHTWTVNEPGRVAELLSAGVDGIIADDPAELLDAAGRGRCSRFRPATSRTVQGSAEE